MGHRQCCAAGEWIFHYLVLHDNLDHPRAYSASNDLHYASDKATTSYACTHRCMAEKREMKTTRWPSPQSIRYDPKKVTGAAIGVEENYASACPSAGTVQLAVYVQYRMYQGRFSGAEEKRHDVEINSPACWVAPERGSTQERRFK